MSDDIGSEQIVVLRGCFWGQMGAGFFREKRGKISILEGSWRIFEMRAVKGKERGDGGACLKDLMVLGLFRSAAVVLFWREVDDDEI